MDKDHPDIFHVEEEFHSTVDRKQYRKDRKRATRGDRSKFKKSDQDQKRKREEVVETSQSALSGRVLSIRSEGILVGSHDEKILCSLKGSLKNEKNLVKNLVAIGDFVLFEKKNTQGVISQILPRKSILSRADNLSRKKEQIIAANVDQVLITGSVVSPPIKPFLIDRYIIAAKKGNLHPVVLINKVDLLKTPPLGIPPDVIQAEKWILKELLKIYKAIGIDVITVSTKTGLGIKALKKVMKGKTSVFSGQSGAGKSSLINATTGTDLEVGKVVEKTKKGSHTTTAASLIPLEGGGFCVDTPGIRSFGVWNVDQEELQSYFEEIQKEAGGCRYQDCKHLEEPFCAVKKAVEEEKISPLRFDSYCALMASLSQQHRNR